MNTTSSTQVECHSGHTYAQRPTAFIWQEKRHQVDKIIAEWHQPEGKFFQVQTPEGQQFTLTFKIEEDRWTIQVH
jgi:hypothetical protein